jgi:hypothetical protein
MPPRVSVGVRTGVAAAGRGCAAGQHPDGSRVDGLLTKVRKSEQIAGEIEAGKHTQTIRRCL